MSAPGWYPDPGGRPGHYRFWDGQAWAPTTTANPAPTSPVGNTSEPRGPRRHVGRWLVVGAVLLIVLAVVAAFVVRDANRTIVDQGPAPTATTTAGDDTSPTPSPTPFPNDASTPPPTPSPSGTPSSGPCPAGDPAARQDHPQDGLVHGGGLSFPAQPGWSSPGAEASGFSWAYDLGETDTLVQPRWYAAYAVGALALADGFEDPRSGAELSMECTASSSFYRGFVSRTDLVSEATTVDGHRAWTIRSQIRLDAPGTTFAGDTVQITVVDLDSEDALAFFWGCAPIGDPTFDERLDQVVEQLHVD